jgi:transcription termination factor NusB
VDLPGGKRHQRIGPQTEQLAANGSAGDAAAELTRRDARDAHLQRLAQVQARQKRQPYMIAHLEANDLLVQLDIVDAFVASQIVDIFDLNSDFHDGSFLPMLQAVGD